MAVTNVWNVVQMQEYPELDGEQDVVCTVHWTFTGTEVVGEETYTGYVYGSQSVTINAEEPFTPYANLTLEQVIGWVQDAMGPETVAAHEANVAQQIQNQINPPIISLPLPWSTPAA